MQRWGVDRWGDTVNFTKLAHEAALKSYYGGGSYAATYEAQLAAAPDGQVMHIFGSGILGKHLDTMEEMCAGGLSIDRLQAALRDARDDEKVSAVVLQLDSPGGLVPAGMSETHTIIGQISAAKSIAQFCDSRTASAAVWLAAACDHTYITPGGELGSIGVYAALIDCSLQLKQLGVNIELVTDGGTYKGAGAFNLPLTAEQKAKVKEEVMHCSGLFKGFMRERRKGISDDTMQGQMFIGQQAIDAKLADSLVNSFEEVIADLAVAAKA
jgi:ClpP class serine protease